MLTKKVRKFGNSLGVLIDKSVCQLANIDLGSEVKIEVRGPQIIIEGLSREELLTMAMERSERKFSKAYKRLSE